MASDGTLPPPAEGPKPEKIKIHFKAVGSAPIMRRNKFQITATEEFHAVDTFLRAQLRLRRQDPLFIYCNSAFAPSPDQVLGSLFECFALGGELIINYSTTEAWG